MVSVAAICADVSVSALPAAGRASHALQVPAATPELLLDQCKRLFEAFQ
jgi:hypothetical protein